VCVCVRMHLSLRVRSVIEISALFQIFATFLQSTDNGSELKESKI
jgi:hypothetical protein